MRGLCTRNVPQPRHLLQLHPALHPLEQLRAPDRRGSTRTMAFRTEPSATWEPTAGHTATALADWANIIAGFNATWHRPKYRPAGGLETPAIVSFWLALRRPLALG